MKKLDVKSTITISLIATLIVITIAVLIAIFCGIIRTDDQLANAIILLFSNSTTMVMTYFFTKKDHTDKDDNTES